MFHTLLNQLQLHFKVCIHTLYKKKTKNKLACIVWNKIGI